MKRLTKRVGAGEAILVAEGDICTPFVKAGLCKTGCIGIFGQWQRHCNDECVLGMMVDRLADYEDAEEQGRLKIFPVMKGQQVFYIGMQGYTTPTVYSTLVDDVGMHSFHVYDGSFGYGDIGKTIFLTHKDAKSALERMKKGGEE